MGATDANFLGHSISPADLRQNAEDVSALINISMTTDVKQVHALMCGVNYHGIFLPDLSKRLRPINSLLWRGVAFAFTSAIEKLVREILAELATPPILFFPNCDAVADESLPFQVCCDACIGGFGAALEQEQEDGSIKPITCVSRAPCQSVNERVSFCFFTESLGFSKTQISPEAKKYIWRRKKKTKTG